MVDLPCSNYPPCFLAQHLSDVTEDQACGTRCCFRPVACEPPQHHPIGLDRVLVPDQHPQIAAAHTWGSRPITRVAASCRVDLHRSQGRIDMNEALVSIRRAFGKVRKRWPAFDVAFAAYWKAVRPGEDLPVNPSGPAGDVLTDTVGDFISEFSPVPGSGLATKGAFQVIRQAREKRAKSEAFKKYDGFEDLYASCSELATPDDPHPELLAEIASLLNTDLCNWDEGDGPAPLFVIFVDTFERLTMEQRRVDERTLNDLMANAKRPFRRYRPQSC